MKLLIESLLQFLLSLYIATSVIFLCVQILPGNANQLLRGLTVTSTEESESIEVSVFESYMQWMRAIVTFDFSPSVYTGRDISDVLFPATRQSIVFILLGVGGATLLCFLFLNLQRLASIVSVLSLAPPRFVLALLLAYFFSDVLNVLPVWSPNIFVRSLVPFLSMSLIGGGLLFQMIDQKVREEYNKDYVRTSLSFGASRRRVVFGHILPNILPNTIVYFGAVISILFGVSAVLERIFSIPGVGSLFVDSVITKDIPMIQASSGIAISLMLFQLNACMYISRRLLSGKITIL